RSIADFVCHTRLIDYQEYKESTTPKPSIDDKTVIDKKDDFVMIDSNTLSSKSSNKRASN
ncbi:MAG: hypothetical protein MJ213_05180, partial [Bacilli bacterium]|nr:hypothetical protein [Bacilli bacterium]